MGTPTNSRSQDRARGLSSCLSLFGLGKVAFISRHQKRLAPTPTSAAAHMLFKKLTRPNQ